MSLTKLAAATAHLSVAIMFVHLQWGNPFNETLWMIYLGVSVLHASYDKTAAMVKEFQERKLGAGVPPQ